MKKKQHFTGKKSLSFYVVGRGLGKNVVERTEVAEIRKAGFCFGEVLRQSLEL